MSECTRKKSCHGAKKLVQVANIGTPKGLQHVAFTNFGSETGKTWYAGMLYRAKARDNGVWLHFCPWCGVDLRPFLEEPPE